MAKDNFDELLRQVVVASDEESLHPFDRESVWDKIHTRSNNKKWYYLLAAATVSGIIFILLFTGQTDKTNLTRKATPASVITPATVGKDTLAALSSGVLARPHPVVNTGSGSLYRNIVTEKPESGEADTIAIVKSPTVLQDTMLSTESNTMTADQPQAAIKEQPAIGAEVIAVEFRPATHDTAVSVDYTAATGRKANRLRFRATEQDSSKYIKVERPGMRLKIRL